MAVKRSKSRGRDLKRTETQAAIDISRIISGEKGTTDGTKDKQSAVSAISPGLQRRKPREFAATNMTARDIANLKEARPFFPNELHVTKNGAVKMARYFVDPTTL